MLDFIRLLWPHPPATGNLTVWTAPDRKSRHAPLADLLALSDEDAAAAMAELHAANQTQHVYFGLGLREPGLPPGRQGGREQVVALPGFALDVDFRVGGAPDAHAAKNLPTEEEAAVLLAGAPDPTAVVHTGHGWHLYWRFREPLLFASGADRAQAAKLYKEFQAPFIEKAKERGWHLDSTATIQRVWRLPGFANLKSGAQVELIHTAPEAAYSLEHLVPPTYNARNRRVDRTVLGQRRSLAPIDNPEAPQDVLAELAGLSKDSPSKELVTLALAGHSFAPRGERDAALHRVCSTIAWMPSAPGYAAEQLAQILKPSLAVWAAEADATKTLDEEVEKAEEKLARALDDRERKDAEEAEKYDGLRAALRGNDLPRAAPIAEDDTPATSAATSATTTPATTAPAPALAPAPPATAPATVLREMIIQCRQSHWMWDFNLGRYRGPVLSGEVPTLARDAWDHPSCPNSLTTEYVTSKGELKTKTTVQLMEEYGTIADQVGATFTAAQSYYDADKQTFIEAMAVPRVSEPAYDPLIDEWLGVLAGRHKDKLLDWIAALPRLDAQCCALYLSGAPGAGKGLLALGLSRLWREGGPAQLEQVLGGYNADMFSCPLVVLDEGLSSTRNTNLSAEVRRLIGSSSHTVTQKYAVSRTCMGSVRMMITANNDNVLSFGEEDLSSFDLEALVSRILRIGARAEAARWLEERNPRGELASQWIAGDGIAKHCLWLALNRDITPGKRFLVEGIELGDVQLNIVMQGREANLVYEWIARFMSNPKVLLQAYMTKHERPRSLVGNGELLVNAQGVIDEWGTYMGEKSRVPSAAKVGATLAKVSDGRRRLGRSGDRIWYHKIRPDMILGWTNNHNIGDLDAMETNLNAARVPPKGMEPEEDVD